MAERGVKHVLNAIATPRANGQIERQNRTILNAIEASADSEVSWDQKLPDVVWGMNQTVNASSRFSPARLMFTHSNGTMANLSEGVARANAPGTSGEQFPVQQKRVIAHRRKAGENLAKAGQSMKARFDRRRKVATEVYKVGDLVLWRQAGTSLGDKGVNRKMTNKYDGPYRVAKVLGHDRYLITTVKGVRGYKSFRAVVAVDSLRRYYSTVAGENGDDSDESEGEAVDRQDLIDLLEG